MKLSVRSVNLWKYWHEMHDFTLIAVDINDGLFGEGRIVLINVGFLWHFNRKVGDE